MIFLLRLMPLETGSALMGWVWQKIAPLTARHARALQHLATAFPQSSPEERERVARASWHNLGQTFAESLQIDRLLSDPGRVTVNNPELLDQVRQQNDGGLFLSFHHGNWEVLASVAIQHDMPIAGIYQKVKNPYVEAYIASTRAPYYPTGLFRKDRHALKELIKIAKTGGYIGMLTDLREATGVEIDFFGQPAATNPFPAMLACRYGRSVLLTRVNRLPNVRFELDLVELPVSQTGNLDADIHATTQAIQSQIETWLKEKPEQWMWAHKRWTAVL